MRQMHDLVELMTGWLQDVQKMDSETLASLMKMGAKVARLLEVKDRMAVTLGLKSSASRAAEPVNPTNPSNLKKN